jgi:hypothetical protein
MRAGESRLEAVNTTQPTQTTQPRQSGITALWVTARDELSARRARAAARRRLASEISDYTTQADRNDLNALLDTYPDSEVAEIRDLLNTAA